MAIEVRPIQSEKAQSPILVTLLGIVTEVRLLQPLKLEEIIVIPSGITKSVKSISLIYISLAYKMGLHFISMLSHPFMSPV